jgi:hypothetical protein
LDCSCDADRFQSRLLERFYSAFELPGAKTLQLDRDLIRVVVRAGDGKKWWPITIKAKKLNSIHSE